MTPIARLIAWIGAARSTTKCAYCSSAEASETSMRVGRDWFCSVEHADEQQLFWSAI